MSRILATVFTAISLNVIIGCNQDSAPDTKTGSKASPFEVEAGKKGSRVRFLTEDDKAILDITSEFGIDQAMVRRNSDKWPKLILVRLHLSGLESFKAVCRDVTVEWSVSSTGENTNRVSLRKGRDETVLDDKSSYHTEVRIVGGNDKIPLKGGYFEVPLPAKLFDGNPDEITLRWIDFYR